MGHEIYENEDSQNTYLIFSVGEESYGIRITYITEVIEIEEVTKVPDLPKYVKGIINLRGKIIPVTDARLRFGKEEREYDEMTCIIIVDIDGVSFGLIVDGVKEVVSMSTEEISPPPSVGRKDDAVKDFIEGIGKKNNEIWLFIDCLKLLAGTDQMKA
jgi:purine-binding chemotaxis protein CheW